MARPPRLMLRKQIIRDVEVRYYFDLEEEMPSNIDSIVCAKCHSRLTDTLTGMRCESGHQIMRNDGLPSVQYLQSYLMEILKHNYHEKRVAKQFMEQETQNEIIKN